MPIPEEISTKYSLLRERAFQKIGILPPILPKIHNQPMTINPDLLKLIVEMCEQILTNFINRVKAAGKGPGVYQHNFETD